MKKKALFTVLTASLMCAAAAITFAACGETKTYSVTYVKSSLNETGSVPTDSTKYEEGKEVTVKGQGDLALDNYTFSGWDYNGKTYAEGEKITMPAKDITLTAKWTADTKLNVTYDLDGGAWEGTAPASKVTSGTEITLPAASAVSKGTTQLFGWTDGRYVWEGGTEYTVTSDVTIKALWSKVTPVKTLTVNSATYEDDQTEADKAEVDFKGFTADFTVKQGKTYTVRLKKVSAVSEGSPTLAMYRSLESMKNWGEELCNTMDGDINYTIPEEAYTGLTFENGEATMSAYFYWANWDDTVSSVYTITVVEGVEIVTHKVSFVIDSDADEFLDYTVLDGVKLDKLPAAPAAPEGAENAIFEGWYSMVRENPSTSPIYSPVNLDTEIKEDLEIVSRWTSAVYRNGLNGANENSVSASLGEKVNGKYTVILGGVDVFTNVKPDAFFHGWNVTINDETKLYFPGEEIEIPAGETPLITANWQDYLEKVEFDNVSVLHWWTDGSTTASLVNGQSVTLIAELTGGVEVWNGIQADINVNGDYYRPRNDAQVFSIHKGTTWDETPGDWSDVKIAWTKGDVNTYIALYAGGATVTQVVKFEAAKDGSTVTLTISSYAGENLYDSLDYIVPETVLTYTITVSDNLTSRNVGFYYDGDEATVQVKSPKLIVDYIYSANQTPTTANSIALGATDYSTEYTGTSPLWTSVISKGEKVVLTGTHASSGEEEFNNIVGYLFTGLAPIGGWCVNHDNSPELAGAATIERTVTKSVGGDGTDDGWKKLIKEIEVDCDVTITVDYTGNDILFIMELKKNEKIIEVTHTFSGEDLAETYKFGLGVDHCHASITSIVRTSQVEAAAE